MKINKPITILIISLMTAFLTSCASGAINHDELNNIKIEIMKTSASSDGISYTLKLKNQSSYIIKQNAVYLSYPIKRGKGVFGNDCKVEAANNKLNIKPNEEVILNITVSSENYNNNESLDSENPQLEIKGYFKEVAEMNHFEKKGDIAAFK